MNSEKVKEIKEALKAYSIEKLKYQDGIKIKELDFIDILTLINELESENEILKINMHETENLSFQINQMNGNLVLENQALKNRIAELEKKIENGTLVELPCKGIEELDIIKKGMVFIFYKMCLEQNFGQGFFIEYKSKINEWFKNYLKNKELQEKQQ